MGTIGLRVIGGGRAFTHLPLFVPIHPLAFVKTDNGTKLAEELNVSS
jgi:hypothetical protein